MLASRVTRFTRSLQLIVGFALAATYCASTSCPAADDDEVVVGPVVVDAQQLQLQQFGGIDFDQQLFQPSGNAKAGEQRLRMHADLQLAELDLICELTDGQKQKLQLAARGDVQRFLDEVAVVRQRFNARKHDQNAFNEIWQELNVLQNKMARGVTGSGSLLAKVVPATLAPEQAERYEVATKERRQFRYRATIAVSLHTLEGTVPLKHDQREALAKLLLELPAPHASGQYDYYLVMYRLAGMPPEKIQPLLDDRQWAALKRHFNQYRGMRETLVEQGLLERDEAAAAIPAMPAAIRAIPLRPAVPAKKVNE